MNSRSGRLLVAIVVVSTTAFLTGCGKPPDSMPATPPAVTASGNVADVDVTENVKTALLRNAVLKGSDIRVVTLKGDVRLIGVLDKQEQIDEAIKVARAADGAHSIHDELTLRK